MRTIIVALALLGCTTAHAVEFIDQRTWDKTNPNNQGMCLENEAGGAIVLTSRIHAGGVLAISTIPSGRVLTGTWKPFGETTVQVTWDVGSTRLFDMSNFRPCRF